MVEAERFHAGNVVMKVVDAITRDFIREKVEQHVEPNQHFKADGLQSHWVLRSMGHELECFPMSGKRGSEELPNVHRVISLFKRFLFGTYHGVSARYLPCYLQEFCFRFNRREETRPLWQSLLHACVFALPITYAEVKR